jgi:amidophosphoribosyltransferase
MAYDQWIDRFKEECGVFGIFNKNQKDIAYLTYAALNSLQHRGQESCGVVFSNMGHISSIKGMGLVLDTFNKENLSKIKGICAIGHVRYSTFGDSNLKNAQPILDSYNKGSIAIAHNGNIINANKVKSTINKKFKTSADSEVILKSIESYLEKSLCIEDSIKNTMKVIKGSYAFLLLTKDSLIGVRDPNGIRPLCIGKIDNSYVLSSESCALDIIGAEFIRDVNPGEIIIIDNNGLKSINTIQNPKCKTCAFEYIYFARQDSIIDNIKVYDFRLELGKQLYKECPIDADIVIGVPESGLAAALGYSRASNIPYEIGFVKNCYVGRTFIAPSQGIRDINTKIKLNVIASNVKDKRVIVVDDSIVRGTTSKKIVNLLKNAGAKEVHFRVSSPMVKFPCNLGINTPSKNELLCAHKNINKIKDILEVDSIGYISIEGFVNCFKQKKYVCMGCFNGNYPVENYKILEDDYYELYNSNGCC